MSQPEYGQKNDQGKPDFSMISYELMDEVAKVRVFGAKKYARSNWKKGFPVTRSLAAVLRHVFQFLSGETNDPESGLSHLAHAVCGLEHAIYDMKHHPGNDDRDSKPERVPVYRPCGVEHATYDTVHHPENDDRHKPGVTTPLQEGGTCILTPAGKLLFRE